MTGVRRRGRPRRSLSKLWENVQALKREEGSIVSASMALHVRRTTVAALWDAPLPMDYYQTGGDAKSPSGESIVPEVIPPRTSDRDHRKSSEHETTALDRPQPGLIEHVETAGRREGLIYRAGLLRVPLEEILRATDPGSARRVRGAELLREVGLISSLREAEPDLAALVAHLEREVTALERQTRDSARSELARVWSEVRRTHQLLAGQNVAPGDKSEEVYSAVAAMVATEEGSDTRHPLSTFLESVRELSIGWSDWSRRTADAARRLAIQERIDAAVAEVRKARDEEVMEWLVAAVKLTLTEMLLQHEVLLLVMSHRRDCDGPTCAVCRSGSQFNASLDKDRNGRAEAAQRRWEAERRPVWEERERTAIERAKREGASEHNRRSRLSIGTG